MQVLWTALHHPCTALQVQGTIHHAARVQVESAQLLRRLDQRENGLRARITSLRLELEKLEEAIERTAIAREELLALEEQDEHAASADTDEPGADARRDDRLPAPVRLSVVAAHDQTAATPSPARQPVGPISDQITLILATSNRDWRAREIAEALGHANPTRAKIESTRSKLEHLVELGLVRKAGAGLFRIAPTAVNGAAHG